MRNYGIMMGISDAIGKIIGVSQKIVFNEAYSLSKNLPSRTLVILENWVSEAMHTGKVEHFNRKGDDKILKE